MTNFIGALYKAKNNRQTDIAEELSSLFCGEPEKSLVWRSKNTFLCINLLKVQYNCNRRELSWDFAENLYIIGDTRLDYIDDLVLSLELNDISTYKFSNNQLIVKAYSKWGDKCVEYLKGDFSFGIWDNKNKTFFCARDHFGIIPFYYYEDNERFIFSNNLSTILAISKLKLRISNYWIKSLLTATVPEKDCTPYVNVRSLLPAHFLKVKSNEVVTSKYWILEKSLDLTIYSEKDIVAELEVRIISSILSKIGKCYPIGAELSGGLDSSGIVGVVSKILESRNQNLDVYTHSLADQLKGITYPFEDELNESKNIVNKYHNNHFVITGYKKGIYDEIMKMIQLYGGPDRANYALFSDLLLNQAAENNNGLLLSGYGGDQGISFSPKTAIYDIAKRKDVKTLWIFLKQSKNSSQILLLFKIILLLIIPRFYHMLKKIKIRKRLIMRYRQFPISKNYEKHNSLRKFFYNSNRIKYETNIDTEHYNKITKNILEHRLETSYVAARARGVQYVYPYLDVKLIEFIYNIPSAFKYNANGGRSIYLKCMKDIIPSENLNVSQNFGTVIPELQHRLLLDRSKFKELIKESKRENKYNYIDLEKLTLYLEKLDSRSSFKFLFLGPNSFLNSIKILILQKWQREGKIDIGIKC